MSMNVEETSTAVTIKPAAVRQYKSRTKEGRYHSLDYLRGLAALGIMVYHYTMWTAGPQDSSEVLGRVGIYGVSIFYVLSGLTLYLIYKRMEGLKGVKNFFIKRLFRIFPLLWIATMATVFIYNTTDWKVLTLNFTGLFGFISPAAGIATGVWSIGNELVFYVMFPLLLLFTRNNLLVIPFLVLAGLYVWFAFFRLDPSLPLEGINWNNYVNPLNQAFLFFSGFMIGVIGKRVRTVTNTILFSVAILFFVLWPSEGDQINIVTGWERMVYTLICIALCLSFYSFKEKADYIHIPLSKLGEASYSLYLLHPIVYYLMPIQDPVVKVIVCAPLSVIGAYLVYKVIEKRFINWGKRLTA